ncbi:molybdopterin dehydrogenase [Thiocystis minor]|uniref:FAD binding domain-containing protein n=1 Tax=Thiocystis minor TaxID=61597 RepID=UPI001913BC9B|nr:xanthine dehydrogenase family protein subunit M [Thiocystis minor]MBK5964699.1 molybdopterin dehydrogenase [Thiocystis minor]
MTQVLIPTSLPELWSALREQPSAHLYAGGTDLLVKRRAGLLDPAILIHLGRIDALRGVTADDDGLRLGAGCTHRELLEDAQVRAVLPVLTQALQTLGSPPIRAMGTLGGNLCTASPAGDTLPPLYVLDAEVELWSAGGERRLLLRDFILGPGRTALQSGEILAAVRVRRAPHGSVQHFEKVGLRNALACSLVSLAALVQTNPAGRVKHAAFAWGSVGPTVIRVPEVERHLIGQPLSLSVLSEAAVLARRAVAPIDDLRADADYRRQVAGNLLLRLAETGSAPER